jgi:glycopeptide antibiotics resistance protein
MMIPVGVLLPAFVVAAGIMLVRWRHGRLSSGHLAAMLVFGVYLFQLANYTLFPLAFNGSYRNFDPWAYVNLVPFRPSSEYGGLSAGQALGNLLLFIPFGFGFPFVWRVTWWKVLVLGSVVSVGLEVIQFILNLVALAFPLRVIDINDVLFNVAGLVIGIGSLLVTSRIYSIFFGAKRGERGVWQHFHDTLIAVARRDTNPAESARRS